jgi:heterogeneous nuclear rnp K-like protein 2
MTETTVVVGDTTASTPSPEQSNADLPALPETDDSKSASGASPPSAHIHMRCLIVTQDASIIIGRNGTHVNEIRDKSSARVMVSESIPGNPERILNVSGPLDAVSKVGSCSLLQPGFF